MDLDWKEIAAIGIGAAISIVGVVVPGGQMLIPIGSSIVGGVLGAAQQWTKENNE